MGWKSFNDRLALVIVAATVGIWVAANYITIPAEVIGATIANLALVIQFYFRRREPEKPEP